MLSEIQEITNLHIRGYIGIGNFDHKVCTNILYSVTSKCAQENYNHSILSDCHNSDVLNILLN